jgi:hypothetical protein
MGLKTTFIAASIINAIYVVGVGSYFALVFLNLTFTFDELPVSSIPFYSGDLPEQTTERYMYHWWEFASDTLRIIPPLLCISAFATQALWGPHSNMAYVLITAIIVVVEAGKTVKRSFDWARCTEYQFCRNFDPDGEPSAINSIFLMAYIYQIGFFVFSVIYVVLITNVVKVNNGSGKKKGME